MRATIGLVVLTLACAGGCASGAAPVAGLPIRTPQYIDVAVPPQMQAAQLEVSRGEALDKARLSLPQIIDRFPRPDYLPAQGTDADGEQAKTITEPPLASQQAYVAGRQAWLGGNRSTAIRQLETAYNLALPNAAICRLLGRIRYQYNPLQASVYLQQAVQLDSTDAASLLLLGRYQVQQGTWHNAIATFAHALDTQNRRKNVDPAIWPLLQFYLAHALDRSGYTLAALHAYGQHLDLPRHVVRSIRFARELAYLRRRRGLTHQQMGDAYHRLNRPDKALVSYQQAAGLGAPERNQLVSRLAYTYLRLGHRQLARDIVLRQVQQSKGEQSSVKLIEYLLDNGINRRDLAGHLRQVYETSSVSDDMAISIASLLGDEQGRQLLRDHVSARPADGAVFAALIQRLVSKSDDATAVDRLVEAISTTAATITVLPAAADRYVTLLLDAGVEPDKWLDAHDRIPAVQRAEPGMRYIKGCILRRAGRTDEAIDQLDLAVSATPQFEAGRLMLVRLLVDRGQFDRAANVLEPLADSDDADVIVLHAQVLARSHGSAEAIELISLHLMQWPDSIALLLEKSRLQLLDQDVDGAERTLLKSVDTHPRQLRLYDALLDIYEFHSPAVNLRRYANLRRNILQAMPNSWLAQLVRAEDAIALGDRDALANTESVLAGLLRQRPKHHRTLSLYLELLWRSGKSQQANDLIDGHVADEPKDSILLRMALQHYSVVRVNDKQRFNETMVMLLLTMPDSEARAQDLSMYYLLLNQPSFAVQVLTPYLQQQAKRPVALVNRLRQAMSELDALEQAAQMINDSIEQFPDHRADLMLQLSMLYQEFAHLDLAEQVLLQILEQFPDHVVANNALGYTWAEQGVYLERAEQLIRQALKADPSSAATRDSLGWIHYKQGRFIDAVTELTNASKEQYGDDPVIRDHLGDALYRLNRPREAKQQWQRALELFNPDEARFNMDQKGLGKRLRTKLEALHQDRQPKTGEVPVQDGSRQPQPST